MRAVLIAEWPAIPSLASTAASGRAGSSAYGDAGRLQRHVLGEVVRLARAVAAEGGVGAGRLRPGRDARLVAVGFAADGEVEEARERDVVGAVGGEHGPRRAAEHRAVAAPGREAQVVDRGLQEQQRVRAADGLPRGERGEHHLAAEGVPDAVDARAGAGERVVQERRDRGRADAAGAVLHLPDGSGADQVARVELREHAGRRGAARRAGHGAPVAAGLGRRTGERARGGGERGGLGDGREQRGELVGLLGGEVARGELPHAGRGGRLEVAGELVRRRVGRLAGAGHLRRALPRRDEQDAGPEDAEQERAPPGVVGALGGEALGEVAIARGGRRPVVVPAVGEQVDVGEAAAAHGRAGVLQRVRGGRAAGLVERQHVHRVVAADDAEGPDGGDREHGGWESVPRGSRHEWVRLKLAATRRPDQARSG